MRLITKDIGYAVRALIILSKQEGIVSVSDLVKKMDVPYAFLRRVMQRLTKEGIVSSYRGKGGGFQLEVSAKKIYMLDIIKIFQSSLDLTRCMIKEKICPNIKGCVLRSEVKEIEAYIKEKFKNLTIDSLKNGGIDNG